MAKLYEAVDAVEAKLKPVLDLHVANEIPEEISGPWPLVIVRPYTGYFEGYVMQAEDGEMGGQHIIAVEVHCCPRKHSVTDYRRARRYGDEIAETLLADPTLGKVIHHFDKLSYQFGDMEQYTGQATLGWLILLEGVWLYLDVA